MFVSRLLVICCLCKTFSLHDLKFSSLIFSCFLCLRIARYALQPLRLGNEEAAAVKARFGILFVELSECSADASQAASHAPERLPRIAYVELLDALFTAQFCRLSLAARLLFSLCMPLFIIRYFDQFRTWKHRVREGRSRSIWILVYSGQRPSWLVRLA